MSDKRRKTNGLELPTFDPKESAVFATKVLNDLKIKCVLIGRLAVWYWLPDPAGHAYTKDLDTAIKKADRQKVIKHLVNLNYNIRELMIGGIHVHSETDNINVDFIDIKKLRGIVDRNIAPTRVKLEQILREVGHPMAHRRKKYYNINTADK